MIKWLYICLALAVPLGLLAASQDRPAEQVGPGVTAVKVTTMTAYGATAAPRFAGRVAAGDSATLAFRVAGQVAALNVQMGDEVQQGAVLAELDPTDYSLDVEAREAEFELARLGAQRARTLHQKQLISEDQFDTAQTLLATSRARLEQARERLSHCKLVAPFSGSIAFTYAMPSEVVAGNQPILELQDTAEIDILFNLPPQYQALTSGEGRATFHVVFDLLPGVQIPASYKEVSLQPDPDTNSYPTTLRVARPADFSPWPGMSVQVALHHPSLLTGKWVLPGEALFERSGNRAYVWRIDETTMTLARTQVTLDGDSVVAGLAPGDRIVAAGVNKLESGQRVRVWQREGGL